MIDTENYHERSLRGYAKIRWRAVKAIFIHQHHGIMEEKRNHEQCPLKGYATEQATNCSSSRDIESKTMSTRTIYHSRDTTPGLRRLILLPKLEREDADDSQTITAPPSNTAVLAIKVVFPLLHSTFTPPVMNKAPPWPAELPENNVDGLLQDIS